MRIITQFGAASIAIVLTLLALLQPARAQDVVVFAAASLTNALDQAARLFERQGGVHARTSYAASSVLAKQIETGAPADIFISADLDWMDYLEQRHLIRSSTRENLLGNRLVLIAPADSKEKVEIKPGMDLAGLLGGGRLAMADPDTIPAGKYGKAALEKLGIWDSVKAAVAPADNVRAALAYVSRRETPFGIVYATDAAADSRVRVVAVFPEDTHPPIVYPAAITAASTNPGAARLLAFLGSPAARPIFDKQGFTVLAHRDGASRAYSPICRSAPRHRASCNDRKKAAAPNPQ
jgi:molybdate transport system substrate-binding protein